MDDMALSTGLDDPGAELSLLVAAKRQAARGIYTFELHDMMGDELPPFTPGAHLTVRTPGGLKRRYSICSPASDRSRYVIAVKQEEGGRGGSASMIGELREGDVLPSAPPENYFPLQDGAAPSLLIAGGIGVTPILAMAHALHDAGRPFRVLYLARSPEEAAFTGELTGPALGAHTQIHFDGGEPARAFDLAGALAAPEPGTHLYCCGPRGLMGAVREASKHWPPGTVHFEDFGAGLHAQDDRAFRVRLARSGREITVAAGESILEALRREGLAMPFSCEAGTCGTCRMTLLAGPADHRDFVLSDAERASAIMVCVSRATGDALTLDA